MRIQLNIIHLLLIAPTFLIVVVVTMFVNSSLPHYYWSIAFQEVNRLDSTIQMLHEMDFIDGEISQQSIEAWLDGSMGSNHRLRENLGESPGGDPWGNLYRCVERSVDGEDRLGVYSLGRDGTSKSNGDDRDDLNSWSDDSLRWYRNATNRRERIDLAVHAGVITVLLYGFFLLFKGAVGSAKSTGKQS